MPILSQISKVKKMADFLLDFMVHDTYAYRMLCMYVHIGRGVSSLKSYMGRGLIIIRIIIRIIIQLLMQVSSLTS